MTLDLWNFFLPVNAFVLLPEVFIEVAVKDGVGEGVAEAEEMEDRVDNGLVALNEWLHQHGVEVHEDVEKVER